MLLTNLTQRLAQQRSQRPTVASMDPEVSPGRRQLIGIAVTVYGPLIVAAVVGSGPRSLLAGLFPAACLVGLVRGWSWARTVTILLLICAVLGVLVEVVFAPATVLPTAVRITLAVAVLSWALALAALMTSPAVEAYDEFLQDPLPDPRRKA